VLDGLPGERVIYQGWQSQRDGLSRLIAGSKRIAMQYSPLCAIPYVSNVDAGTIELVRTTGVEIVSSADLIQQFEARWTADQYESHIEAGRRVDQVRREAFALIGQRLRDGGSIDEYGVKTFVRQAFDRAGLTNDDGPIVAVNEHMSDPHYDADAASAKPIRRGDAVLLDMWAKLRGPHSVFYDITWTAFCGEHVPEAMAKVFGVVSGARDRAVETVRSAVAAGESLPAYRVDDAARSWIREQGYGDYFVHRTGHSIGEDIHGAGANMDNFETHDERKIIAGTCFSVEPGVYLPEFGIRSEVNLYVGEKQAHVTGEIQREMVTIA